VQDKKDEREQEKKELAKGGPPKEEVDDDDKPKPNPVLEQGKPLPKNMSDFPLELYGKPIEEIDEFYNAENVCLLFVNIQIIFWYN